MADRTPTKRPRTWSEGAEYAAKVCTIQAQISQAQNQQESARQQECLARRVLETPTTTGAADRRKASAKLKDAKKLLAAASDTEMVLQEEMLDFTSEMVPWDPTPASWQQKPEQKSAMNVTVTSMPILKEATKTGEETQKLSEGLTIKISGDIKWVFAKDTSTNLPYVYVSLERGFGGNSTEVDTVLGIYATITDANNSVRNHCAQFVDRDHLFLDVDFSEGMEDDGRIWWKCIDGDGDGREVRIRKCLIEAPGSVMGQDWGQRPFGMPLHF